MLQLAKRLVNKVVCKNGGIALESHPSLFPEILFV